MGVYINIDVKEIRHGAVAVLNIDDVAFFVKGKDIIAVPDHGDLIDRDELIKHEVYIPLDGGNLPVVYTSYVKAAKTVIPAERSEE